MGGLALAAPLAVTPAVAATETVSVVADNLNNPRGLAIGPDGAVYVAESGKAGSTCFGEGDQEACVSASGSVTKVAGGSRPASSGASSPVAAATAASPEVPLACR